MSHEQHPRTPPKVEDRDLVAGDVLLCYSQMMKGAHAEIDGYGHAAICIDVGMVLNADSSGGVVVCPVADLLDTHDHIAVLRSLDLWDCDAVDRLRAFVGESAGKPFNQIGMLRVPSRQEEHLETVMDKLDAFFKTGAATSPVVGSYFCSQLVAAAFVYAGVIGESASVVLSPEVATPLGMSFDAVYGTFIGYLAPPGYRVPRGDRFEGAWGQANLVQDR